MPNGRRLVGGPFPVSGTCQCLILTNKVIMDRALGENFHGKMYDQLSESAHRKQPTRITHVRILLPTELGNIQPHAFRGRWYSPSGLSPSPCAHLVARSAHVRRLIFSLARWTCQPPLMSWRIAVHRSAVAPAVYPSSTVVPLSFS
jgi:hypothetical protein